MDVLVIYYQKIQIIAHVMKQPTNHCRQMDYFVGSNALEQPPGCLQITVEVQHNIIMYIMGTDKIKTIIAYVKSASLEDAKYQSSSADL